jgi:hypothetical protein
MCGHSIGTPPQKVGIAVTDLGGCDRPDLGIRVLVR